MCLKYIFEPFFQFQLMKNCVNYNILVYNFMQFKTSVRNVKVIIFLSKIILVKNNEETVIFKNYVN